MSFSDFSATSYPFLRRLTDPSPSILDQYYLLAYAARSWNTLSIPIFYIILRDITFYVKSNMTLEVAGHVKLNC